MCFTRCLLKANIVWLKDESSVMSYNATSSSQWASLDITAVSFGNWFPTNELQTVPTHIYWPQTNLLSHFQRSWMLAGSLVR